MFIIRLLSLLFLMVSGLTNVVFGSDVSVVRDVDSAVSVLQSVRFNSNNLKVSLYDGAPSSDAQVWNFITNNSNGSGAQEDPKSFFEDKISCNSNTAYKTDKGFYMTLSALAAYFGNGDCLNYFLDLGLESLSGMVMKPGLFRKDGDVVIALKDMNDILADDMKGIISARQSAKQKLYDHKINTLKESFSLGVDHLQLVGECINDAQIKIFNLIKQGELKKANTDRNKSNEFSFGRNVVYSTNAGPMSLASIAAFCGSLDDLKYLVLELNHDVKLYDEKAVSLLDCLVIDGINKEVKSFIQQVQDPRELTSLREHVVASKRSVGGSCGGAGMTIGGSNNGNCNNGNSFLSQVNSHIAAHNVADALTGMDSGANCCVLL